MTSVRNCSSMCCVAPLCHPVGPPLAKGRRAKPDRVPILWRRLPILHSRNHAPSIALGKRLLRSCGTLHLPVEVRRKTGPRLKGGVRGWLAERPPNLPRRRCPCLWSRCAMLALSLICCVPAMSKRPRIVVGGRETFRPRGMHHPQEVVGPR